MNSFITSIGTAVPEYQYSLESFIAWAESTHQLPVSKRKLQFLAKDAGIDTKHTVVDDFSYNGEGSLYQWNSEGYTDPLTTKRLENFLPLATKLGVKAAEDCLKSRGIETSDITHVIAVSCTGIQAPGLEIALHKALALSNQVERMAVNFLGCYAAFHAFKMADYICRANPSSKVLIVSVELCSLHFRNDDTNDNLLSTILFSDGAAAAIVEGKKPHKRTSFQWRTFHSALIREGESDMGWHIGNGGFEMTLSSRVSQHIGNHIRTVYQELLDKCAINATDVKGYAIHPGGKNILRAFADAIGCGEHDLHPSFDVMRRYGNMSSATIMFVLKDILHGDYPDGHYYSAAFGPGLTVESGMFVRS